MSWQTAHFRKAIDKAKTGDKESLALCRRLLKRVAEDGDIPDEAIVELSECLLALGIEQGRKDAEVN